jgi:hypothetical protein
MADFDDQHKQDLILSAEQQAQIGNSYAVELIVGLQANHPWMAGRLAQPAQLAVYPSLQHGIET